MKKQSDELLLALAALSVLYVKSNNRGNSRSQRNILLALAAGAYYYNRLVSEMNLKRITVHYPSQMMQFFDDDTFEKMFRFRRQDFSRVLDALQLTGTIILCGRERRQIRVHAEIALMVVLRRLAFPCRFVDLVNVFGMPSNRICDIFHSTVDHLYDKFARRLNQYSIWIDYFPAFARAMQEFGAPYDNLINIFDGHFIAVCRPGGLGNVKSLLDQSELYSGEKGQHGIKYLVAQFPNGMTSLSGPFKGRCHDGRMLRESKWEEILRNVAAQPDGRSYIMFGDSGFCVSDHIQAMVKSYAGYIQDDARTYNNLMSRIRIYIENFFAESS
jgi:hypothetical protein